MAALERTKQASAPEFAVFDCSLARCAIGRSCTNLRELLEAVRTVPGPVLEHHLVRCALEDHFELYEFPNDLARWCWEALGDSALAEQLGLADPYRHESIEALRQELVEVIEGRLWGLERVPWCRPGLELHLLSSRLIAYDTGQRIATVPALIEAIRSLPLRSLFYHVHDARRRNGGASDDFSSWLLRRGEDELATRVRAIDLYFLNLGQLREQLLAALQPVPAHA